MISLFGKLFKRGEKKGTKRWNKKKEEKRRGENEKRKKKNSEVWWEVKGNESKN